jgi:hypothetical protein
MPAPFRDLQRIPGPSVNRAGGSCNFQSISCLEAICQLAGQVCASDLWTGALAESRSILDPDGTRRKQARSPDEEGRQVFRTALLDGILCAGRRRYRTPHPGFSLKNFDITDGVPGFVLTPLATSYKCVRRDRVAKFMPIAQAHDPRGNEDRFRAPNTRHSTIAFYQRCAHSNLTGRISRAADHSTALGQNPYTEKPAHSAMLKFR